MSGPKCAYVPPRYSAQVFDGALLRLLQLQGELSREHSTLEALLRSEGRPSEGLTAEVQRACATPTLNIPAQFGPTEFTSIGGQLRALESNASALLERIRHAHAECLDAAEDRRAHARWAVYRAGIEADFHRTREDARREVERALGSTEAGASAAREIAGLGHGIPTETPVEGLRLRYERERSALDGALSRASRAVHDVYARHLGRAAGARSRPEDQLDQRSREVATRVREELGAVRDPAAREEFSRRLSALIGDASRGPYALSDLADDLRRRRVTEQCRDGLRSIREGAAVGALEGARRAAAEAALDEASRRAVLSEADVSRADNVIRRLCDEARAEREREAAADLERREIGVARRCLVEAVRNLGFSVVEGTEVIDLSQEGDLLLEFEGSELLVSLELTDRQMAWRPVYAGDVAAQSAETQRTLRDDMNRHCAVIERAVGRVRQVGIGLTMRQQPADLRRILPASAAHREALDARRKRRDPGPKPGVKAQT